MTEPSCSDAFVEPAVRIGRPLYRAPQEVVNVPMAGNPDAVLAGAAQFSAAADGLTAGADDVRAAGNEMAAGWSGAAAAAAGEMTTRLGTTAAIPGEVAAEVRPILETYAQALRAAQQAFALGEQMAAQGAENQLREARQPTSRASDQVLGQAAARVEEGKAMQAQAIAAEQQANQAAASAVQSLAARISAMQIEAPGGGAAVAVPASGGADAHMGRPGPAGAGRSPAFGQGAFVGQDTLDRAAGLPAASGPPPIGGSSAADLGHTVLDIGGLVPVFGEPLDLVNAAWYGAEGDYVSAALSSGSAVPVAGWVFTGGKVVNRGVKFVDSAADARVWLKEKPPMVPDNAKRGEFVPDENFPSGDSFWWRSAEGNRVEYWSHGPDPRIDPAFNAGRGPIYRVREKNYFLSADGTWYRKNAFNSNSPYFVPRAANDTHIPYPSNLPPPGADPFLAPNPLALGDGVGGSEGR